MYSMVATTIREVLERAAVFDGWFYLPEKPWSKDTQGIFVKEDRGADPSDPFPPQILSPCRLVEALDAEGIEDIISNAESQLDSPSIEKLFEAFLFYIENDAFIEF